MAAKPKNAAAARRKYSIRGTSPEVGGSTGI